MDEKQEFWVCNQENSVHSWDGPYQTREEAARAGFESGNFDDPDVVYTGVSKKPEVPLDCWGQYVIERIANNLYDEGHELAEDWPSVKNEEYDKLDVMIGEVLRRWLSETGNWPTWWLIDDLQRHEKGSS